MINLPNPNQPQKKPNNQSNNLSGYTSSALEEGPTEQYVPPQESYSEREDEKEQTGMEPAARPQQEMQQYEEPSYEEEPTYSPRQTQAPAPRGYEIPPAPVYPEYPPTPSVERIRKEEVEALIEQIIEEKWDELTIDIGDISIWKEKVRTEIISIKQELLRLEHRFEQVNKAVLGKVSQYDTSIKSVGTDVKAVERALQKILQPLTINIKELQRLTTRLKK